MMKPLAKGRAGLGYVQRAEGPQGCYRDARGAPETEGSWRRWSTPGGLSQASSPQHPSSGSPPPDSPPPLCPPPLSPPPLSLLPHYPLFLGLRQQHHPLPTLLHLHLLLHEGPHSAGRSLRDCRSAWQTRPSAQGRVPLTRRGRVSSEVSPQASHWLSPWSPR